MFFVLRLARFAFLDFFGLVGGLSSDVPGFGVRGWVLLAELLR